MAEVVRQQPAAPAGGAAQSKPRAEFRVFGHDLIDGLRERLYNGRTVLLQARRMPTETYVVPTRLDDVNVKLRDGLLDVKLRIARTAEGYEIFRPQGKWPFPVGRAELASVLALLKVDLPLDGERIDVETFIAGARAHPGLRVVTVDKLRHGFSIDGVTCEHAQVWFNGALLETACVESEDPAAMARVIGELGLGALPNTSYVRAAQRVVGLI